MSGVVGKSMGGGTGYAAQRFLQQGKQWSTVASQTFSPGLVEKRQSALPSSSAGEGSRWTSNAAIQSSDALDNSGALRGENPSQPGFLHPRDREKTVQRETQARSSIAPSNDPRKRAWSSRNGSATHGGSYLQTPSIAERHPPRSVSSNYRGGSRNETRSDNKLVPMATPADTKKQYRVGMIFWAAFHEPHRRNGIARAGNTTDVSGIQDPKMKSKIQQTTSTAYGNVHSKMRPMIVVSLYETHYVALPLYTHGGTGLRNAKNPLEYVSVRDHRWQEPFTKLSNWNPLITGQMTPGSQFIELLSTVKLTYPISRDYEVEGFRVGYLDRESTVYLTELYLYHVPQLPNPPEIADKKASIKIETHKLDAAKQDLMTRKRALKSKKDQGGDPSELLGITQDTMQVAESLIEMFERKLTLIESIAVNTKPTPKHGSAPPARRVGTVLEEGEILED